MDYFNKHRDRLEKLVKLYSETLENIIKHDDAYRSILSHIKKGFNDIINELFTKIQIDPYTHIGGRVQVLENHRKALEEKIKIYKEDVEDLQKRLIVKDRELDTTLEESFKMRDEKESIEQKLKELRRKVMFTTECLRFENDAELLKACTSKGKSFSTRSYHTPSPIKKMKEIAVRKDFNLTVCSKIERNLLKFMLYLEDKGIPVINIFKDEFLKIKEKKVLAQLDSKVDKLKWELFEDDNQLLLNDDDYNNGISYDGKKVSFQNSHKKPLLNSNSKHQSRARNILKKSSSLRNSEDQSKENEHVHHVYRHNSEQSKKSRTHSGSSNNRDFSNGRISFHSDDSFRPICSGPPLMNEKPSCVPVLDFKNLSAF